MKKLFTVCTLFLLVSFNQVNAADTGLTIDVKTTSFTSKDKVKLTHAVEVLKVVMNSEEFKTALLEFKFNEQDNQGMTNIDIYNHLMTGAEVLNGEVNHVMDFDLKMYRSKNPWSKVKGYTKPDTNRIWIHSKFYRRKSWTPVDIAANMAHEWTHKMGFGHEYYHSDIRSFSVPYGVGSIVTKVANQLGFK